MVMSWPNWVRSWEPCATADAASAPTRGNQISHRTDENPINPPETQSAHCGRCEELSQNPCCIFLGILASGSPPEVIYPHLSRSVPTTRVTGRKSSPDVAWLKGKHPDGGEQFSALASNSL